MQLFESSAQSAWQRPDAEETDDEDVIRGILHLFDLPGELDIEKIIK